MRRLRGKLGLPLHDGCASVFAPEELAPATAPSLDWEELIPGALALYRRLEESADLPAHKATTFGARRPARERELLRTSELLLFALLERGDGGGPTPPLELRQAYHRLRVQEETVVALETAQANDRARIRELEAALREERARSAAAEARSVEVARVLAKIEKSRSFAPVRAWWWLRRQLGR